jgi:DNA mismatch endonuclease (patch repair protein)
MADKEEIILVPRFKSSNGFYTTGERSKHMAKIKASNTKPELALRRALWKLNIRYRKTNKDLPGNPDIAIRKYKIAVFIDGEFWHGYNWEDKKPRIKANRGFWIPKIERNMQRDKENNIKLNKMGYTVFRFWEAIIRKDVSQCVNEICQYITRAKA